MDHFAGLDISVKETSVCIVDDTGRIVKEVKVASEPAALLKVLGNPTYRFKRIGLEAGPLSQWLFGALAEAINFGLDLAVQMGFESAWHFSPGGGWGVAIAARAVPVVSVSAATDPSRSSIVWSSVE